MNKTHQLYDKYFNTYRKEYDSEDLNEEDIFLFDPSLYKIFGQKKQKSGSTKKQIDKVPQKPSWFEINRPKFEEVTKNTYINQDNKDFKINTEGGIMIWKKQKQFGQK